MALTLKKEQRITDSKLDQLYKNNKKLWLDKARKAYDYFDSSKPQGEHTRVDDVAGVLLPMLDVDKTLKKFLQGNGLKQKYYVSDFCDYILEETWDSLVPKAGASK